MYCVEESFVVVVIGSCDGKDRAALFRVLRDGHVVYGLGEFWTIILDVFHINDHLQSKSWSLS